MNRILPCQKDKLAKIYQSFSVEFWYYISWHWYLLAFKMDSVPQLKVGFFRSGIGVCSVLLRDVQGLHGWVRPARNVSPPVSSEWERWYPLAFIGKLFAKKLVAFGYKLFKNFFNFVVPRKNLQNMYSVC